MAPHTVADAERLRRLQLLTDAALSHLELDELLDALLVRARDVLGADTAAFLLLDDERDELVARAAVGIEEEVEQSVRIPVGRGFAGRVAAGRRPVVLDDVDHADVLNPLLREKGIKSLVGVPLIVAGRVIGVLHVGTLVHRHFDADDVQLLQLAGDRAAIAIERAWLFEAERSARERLENLQAVTDVALAHLQLDELLGVLLVRIRDILGADTASLLMLDEDRQELVARAALGLEEGVERGVRVPVGRGFAGRVAGTRARLIVDDLRPGDAVNPLLYEKGIRSLLGVPLFTGERILGVLHVGARAPRSFTNGDAELLELVGERVAVAVQRARLHEEIVQLDQLKLNFVAIASHELRTPATSVYGVLATLVQRGDLAEDAREELLQVGWEQAQRLRRLLEQLLDLSRLDAEAIAVEPRPIALRNAIAEIATAAVPPDTQVRIEVAADAAVVVDPIVLERVLSNLLVNAVRHGIGPIVVAAEQRDRHLRIVVEDSGAGVAPELQHRLFERFARGDSKGTGLGLAIARAYARAHGGDLVYEPRERGARFELIVPVAG